MLIHYSTSINLLIFAGERRQSVTHPKHDILDIEYVVDQVNRMRGEVSIGMCLGVGKMTVIIQPRVYFGGQLAQNPQDLI